MYVVFYVLPVYIALHLSHFLFVFIWTFGGIIIIAAVAGYISKGVTIWEPVIAGVGLAFAIILVMIIYVREHFNENLFTSRKFVELLVPLVVVFLLSLFGAWFGERARKLWKTQSPEST